MRWIDEKFREDPVHYLTQTLIAFLSIALIAGAMLLLTEEEIVTAALGATAFIVFAMPKHDTARARSVVGGNAIGIGIGLLFSALVRCDTLSLVPRATFIGLVVALAIFGMVLTDTEHPPAAGNALAFAIVPVDLWLAFAALGAVTALALVRFLLRNWLRDLV